MKVGAAIYSMLKDDSAVAALVGTRIYPELAEEGAATPYVVYSVVSNTPVDTKESAPVDEAQLEVFSVADTYAAANDLADKVRTALARKGKKVYGTVTVQSVKYTNEVTEVSAARDMYISVQDYTARLTPVIPNLLLEQYPGAYAAYSLRRVRGEYTGPAIRIRKAATTDKLDIGFDQSGNLDIAAINAFAEGSACQLETWYDQSGRGQNITQTTTGSQPRIRHATDGVDTVDGKAAVRFNGSTHNLSLYSADLDIGNLSSFAVCKFSNTSGSQYALAISGANNDKRWFAPIITGSKFSYYYNGGVALAQSAADTDNNLHAMVAGSTQGNAQAFLNGTSLGTDSLDSGIDSTVNGIGALSTGGVNPVAFMDGYVQEIVIYASDQSANRTGIESNINTHYGIY